MNHIDFISNHRIPAPWPKHGWAAIALSVAILLAMAVGIRAFAYEDYAAEKPDCADGQVPEWDFAWVDYNHPNTGEAAKSAEAAGFDVHKIEAYSQPETCNEHGARAEAENLWKQCKVGHYAFAGGYDYSLGGENANWCTVWVLNGSLRGVTLSSKGYVDA